MSDSRRGEFKKGIVERTAARANNAAQRINRKREDRIKVRRLGSKPVESVEEFAALVNAFTPDTLTLDQLRLFDEIQRYQSEYRLEELMVIPGLDPAAAGRYLAALDAGIISRLVHMASTPEATTEVRVLCFNSMYNMMAQEAEAPRWIEELVLRTPFPQMAATLLANPAPNELYSAVVALCWVVMQAGGCYRDLMMAQQPCIVGSVAAAVSHFCTPTIIVEAACLMSVLFKFSPLPSPALISESIWPFTRQCVMECQPSTETSLETLALHRATTIVHALARCNAGGYRFAMIRDRQLLGALSVLAASASADVNTRCEVVEALAQLMCVPEAHEVLFEARAMHALLTCAAHPNQFVRNNALSGLMSCNMSVVGRERCVSSDEGRATLLHQARCGSSKSRVYALEVVAQCIHNADGTENATALYGAWMASDVIPALCTCFELYTPMLTRFCVQALSRLLMDPHHAERAAHAFEEQGGVDKLELELQRSDDMVLCEVGEAIIHCVEAH